jgi:hypothetical protein
VGKFRDRDCDYFIFLEDKLFQIRFCVRRMDCVVLYVKIKIMDTKLTVRLNDKVIKRAKIYARSHKVSLSKMIESYLDSVTKEKGNEIEITPLVESLSGVVHLPDDYDYKKNYADYLQAKYK